MNVRTTTAERHAAARGGRARTIGYERRGGLAVGLAAVMLGLPSADARAQTAFPLETCAEVAAQWSAYRAAGSTGVQPNTTQCWDFEDAFNQGMGNSHSGQWTRTGTAFDRQPTYGDNVQAQRVLQDGANHAQRDQLSSIGGDYWQVPYPIGHQGQYWVGTYEGRPYEINAWAGTQGDGPTGSAASAEFEIDRNYIAFLVGGGCDSSAVYVQLQVKDALGQWVQATHARWAGTNNGSPYRYRTTGQCSERMLRRHWATDRESGLFGKRARVVITDGATGRWGHINVDHMIITSQSGLPTDLDGRNQPVWGFADTHAHPLNELGFRSEGPVGSAGPTSSDGYLFHGTTGNTPSSAPQNHLTSCDSKGHRTNHQGGPTVLGMLEGASFGRSPAFANYAAQDIVYHNGDGMGGPSGKDLVGYPYWFSRAHQQMYMGWIRRAYEGGLRLMVAAAGNNEALAMFMREGHGYAYRSDYGLMRKFALRMKEIADYPGNSSWMQIAYSPAGARDIIRQNKLALILALELDDIGDECGGRLTETAAFTARDENRTTSTSPPGSNPWNQIKDRGEAQSCSTAAQWQTRIADLYSLGYRLVTPIHLANNDLGGAAVYSDLFNIGNYFGTGWFYMVQTSPDVRFKLSTTSALPSWCHGNPCAASESGFLAVMGLMFGFDVDTPTRVSFGPLPYPSVSGQGHINTVPLTRNGETALKAMKERGMLIDLAHMGQHGRQKVLGLGPYRNSSIANPSCDMDESACRRVNSYPVLATHAGLGQLGLRGASENDLSVAMIQRIRDIGGTVAIGTSNADVKATQAATGGTWHSSTIYAQHVANHCGGSSRSFAQSYVYGLRVMNGRGLTLGTDMNGLESQVNPRFGTLGCYARGNIPRVYYVGHDGRFLIDEVSAVPYNFDHFKIKMDAPGDRGTAGGQRDEEYGASAGGLNYTHYEGTPPSRRANVSATSQFQRLRDPANYVANIQGMQFGKVVWGGSWINEYAGPTDDVAMPKLSGLSALNASVTGNRTFDFNFDGLAHYGMLPDLLQDARAVGITTEQLGPLFQSAEAVIQTWERACAWAKRPGNVSNPSVSDLGCS